MATTMDFISPSASHLKATRKRVSCNKCRTRKLKCSGETDGCSRCKMEHIVCEFSYQKKMGRPRKRQREGIGEIQNAVDTRDASLNSGGAGEGPSRQELNPDQPCAQSIDPSRFEQSQDDFIWTLPGELGDFSLDNHAVLNNPADTSQRPLAAFGDSFLESLDVLPALTDRNTNLYASGQALPRPTNNDYNNPSSSPSCDCLTNLYLTLASFQTLPSPSFPQSFGILTKATNLGRTVLRCLECRKTYVTAVQNLMLLCTLLTLIANEYARLLTYVCERVRTADGKIIMRIGEHTPGMEHLHTNMPDCPMGFNIAMTGEEWGVMVRKVIRTEVLGTEEQEGNSLLEFVDEMGERQRLWHTMPARDAQCEQRQPCEGHTLAGRESHSTCLSLVNNLRRSVIGLDL